jgi:mycofactocin precursor
MGISFPRGGDDGQAMTDEAALHGELSDDGAEEEPVLESLIEETSVDGMCGVY